MNKRFSIRTLVCSGLALSLFTFSAAFANAQVVIDDSFDDGALDTNTTGIGDGFVFGTAGPAGGVASETADGFASLSTSTNGGRRAFFASSNTVDLTNGASFLFEDVNFGIADPNNPGGDTNRTYFGIRGVEGANDAQLGPGEGLYLQFFDQELATEVTPGRTDISSFVYIDAAGTRTELAAFTFDDLAVTADSVDDTPVDVLITLNGSDYALDITGSLGNITDPGVDVIGGGQAISFSGTLDTAPSFTDSYIFGFNQSENPSLDLRIGRIEATVVAVPEPTSVMLLGLGSIALLARRKRS